VRSKIYCRQDKAYCCYSALLSSASFAHLWGCLWKRNEILLRCLRDCRQSSSIQSCSKHWTEFGRGRGIWCFVLTNAVILSQVYASQSYVRVPSFMSHITRPLLLLVRCRAVQVAWAPEEGGQWYLQMYYKPKCSGSPGTERDEQINRQLYLMSLVVNKGAEC
jgi:hypothetical protein